MASAVTALGQSGWLYYVHTILSNAAWIAGRVVMEGASVLVHCRYTHKHRSRIYRNQDSLVSIVNLFLSLNF